ncbi:hypothetical protein [Actinomadura rubrisoli]|uniref:HK97 gp10 family phage protein n=1 Tax=Actinomadura rubrisoli TaxID=2530368 RepID=A0A4R5CJQ0_9ACTN|nr:hypothetical protein [Actinomadura rubrisoli]TDD97642.1 hypothetical protein E1298_01005 [Actinomadura rubrisoli]
MASAKIRYEMNFAGLGKIMRGKQMEAMLRGEAQKGKQYAELIAPVETGDYKSRFRVSSAPRGAGRWADRAAGYLHNDSDHALHVEYTDDYRTLGVVASIIETGL